MSAMVAAKLHTMKNGRPSKETASNDGVSKTDAAKQSKEARNRKIFDMWLACYSQQEIADAVGLTQGEVAKNIPNGDIAELNKSDQSAADHATDFTPPIYNIWKQQEKTSGSSHFGNSERVAASQTSFLASRRQLSRVGAFVRQRGV